MVPDEVVVRVTADVEARAIQIHAQSTWDRLPLKVKARYRLVAATQLAAD